MGEQQEQVKHKGEKQWKQIEHQGHETRDCQNKTGMAHRLKLRQGHVHLTKNENMRTIKGDKHRQGKGMEQGTHREQERNMEGETSC